MRRSYPDEYFRRTRRRIIGFGSWPELMPENCRHVYTAGCRVDYMNKTEAAEIIANLVVVRARKFGVTDITATFIGQVIGYARYETETGSPLHQAAWMRPSDELIRRAGRKAAAR